MLNLSRRCAFGLFLVGMAWSAAAPPLAADDKTAITPDEILGKQFEGQATIEFVVGKAGQLIEFRSIKEGESDAVYLAPQVEGKTGSRVYVILSWQVATRLRKLGIDDPSEHFRGKRLRASGVVQQLSGNNPPRDRIMLVAPGKSESVKSSGAPEYYINVTSLDQVEVVRKP